MRWNILTMGFLLEEAGGDGGGGGGAAPQVALGGQPPAAAATSQQQEAPKPIELAGWKTGLPEEFSKNKTIAQLPDTPEGFHAGLKSLINAQKLVGVDVMPVPREGWTEDQWNDFHAKAGRPENADGYEVKTPEGFPEDIKLDDAKLKGWKEQFHKLGLTKQQGEGLMSAFLSSIGQEAQGHTQSVQAQLDADFQALQEGAGDKLPVIIDKANAALIKTDGAGVVEILTKANLQNNPVITNWLAKLSDMVASDRVLGEGDQNLGSEQAKALSEIERLKGDPGFQARFMNRQEPGHKEAVTQMNRLRQLAYPNE